MFSICEAMEWNHLPVAGGIYDQHPQLLDDWGVIWVAKSQMQKRKEAETKRK